MVAAVSPTRLGASARLSWLSGIKLAQVMLPRM